MRDTIPACELAPGYAVPRVLNGCWQLSDGHRRDPVDREAAIEGLLRLAEAGLTAFDCGDIYVGVEELLGEVVRHAATRGLGGAIRVHTKLVPDRDDLARVDRRYVEAIVDRSLRRLGVERLDLVQLAWWDYDVPGYVEAARILDDLRRAGKIRHVGATNFDAPRLRTILDAGVALVSHQVQYSLLDRRPERGMAALCDARGVHLLAYGALAGGFLSRRYVGQPPPQPPLANRSLVKYRLMIDELGGWERYQELLAALGAVADRHGVSLATAAARWTLERPGVAAVLIGATGARHLEDTLRVFTFTFDEADHALLAPFAAAGPPGDTFAAERDPSGPHAPLLRTNLNRTT